MQQYVKAARLVVLTLAVSSSICGMGLNEADDHRQPVVIEAAVPTYSQRALSSNATGEVVVEVKIDSRGLVKSARVVSGQPILAADSRRTAGRWKFAPSMDKPRVRTVQLTFVYRLVPRDTPFEQLLPVFKLPYRVEVAHTVPVAEPAAPFIAALIQSGQARLVERLKLLVEYQSTQQWQKQYDLLSVLVTQGDSKEDHTKRLQHWYAEGLGDLLVDFTPKSATYEGGGPSDVVIFGCAKLRRNGSIVELYASVEAYREKQDWYFSPVGIITPVDGKPEACPYSKSNR